ncbi:HAD family hydrolase [Halogranum rubrum]|uniref:HAD family hydrolase n=1 Tax=Halogranum salarium B-1 TaxID=1210908 RepID=J3JFF8_9EURY|nr:HAD family hydrolase [Halogranum salarium]EJN59219.1 hypothetical protein HSB1_26400 [Halogranum salarium B-1]
MSSFTATLFDLDGTLCRQEQDVETIYYGAFEQAGVDPFGVPSDLWNALDGPPPTTPKGQTRYLTGGFVKVAAQYGRQSVDPTALADGFLDTVDYAAVSLLPGATAALDAARDEGFVGLVTNGPEYRQSVKLDALSLVDAFDVVVFAGDMTRRKPHRDPFDHALASIETAAESALYVGNSLEYDVAGAQGAGLRAAWYREDETADAGAYRPDYVLDSLTDLSAIFEETP